MGYRERRGVSTKVHRLWRTLRSGLGDRASAREAGLHVGHPKALDHKKAELGLPDA